MQQPSSGVGHTGSESTMSEAARLSVAMELSSHEKTLGRNHSVIVNKESPLRCACGEGSSKMRQTILPGVNGQDGRPP
jgi:hypothetical protein